MFKKRNEYKIDVFIKAVLRVKVANARFATLV